MLSELGCRGLQGAAGSLQSGDDGGQFGGRGFVGDKLDQGRPANNSAGSRGQRLPDLIGRRDTKAEDGRRRAGSGEPVEQIAVVDERSLTVARHSGARHALGVAPGQGGDARDRLRSSVGCRDHDEVQAMGTCRGCVGSRLQAGHVGHEKAVRTDFPK